MFIDTNVYVDRWPFRRVPGDEPADLVHRLKKYEVTQAWAASLDSLLHRDVAAVNQRLAETCRQHGDGVLVPMGCINPMFPDWEEDLRRCHEVHQMPGIRLHPSYHGYTLADPAIARLLELAGQSGLLVQIALLMEDERTQHPLLRVDAVDAKPLVGLLENLAGVQVQLLNSRRQVPPAVLEELTGSGRVAIDIAMLESVGGISKLIKQVGIEAIAFGSYSPVFYFESSWLKLRESGLDEGQTRTIVHENARRLLAGAKSASEKENVGGTP